MNTICSRDKNRLSVDQLLENLLVFLVGPPISNFNPTPYVKKWLMAIGAGSGKPGEVQAPLNHLNPPDN